MECCRELQERQFSEACVLIKLCTPTGLGVAHLQRMTRSLCQTIVQRALLTQRQPEGVNLEIRPDPDDDLQSSL